MKQIYKYAIYMVAIMLLSSCYPIRRVGLLQEREGLPEYEKGEYEQYHLQKNDELELRVISMNPETALLFQQRASSYLSTNSSSFTYRIYEDGTIDVPFLSKVHVAGLTLQQAEQKIEEELAEFSEDIMVGSFDRNILCYRRCWTWLFPYL